MPGTLLRVVSSGCLWLAAMLALGPVSGCQTDDGTVLTYIDDADAGFIARKLRILAIDPSSGPLDGGQLVALTGTGFQPDMTVSFGSNPAEKLIVGGDELAVMRTPAALEPGPVDVTVTLGDGRTATVISGYEYLPRPVTSVDLLVLGVTPNKGKLAGGDMVVVEGKGFIEGATVSFDGIPATSVRYLGETALSCIVPAGASPGLVDVTVSTPEFGTRPAAQDNLLNAYTYLPDTDVIDNTLLVLGVLPNTGPLSGGNLVTLRGQGFEQGARVYIGGTLATDVEVLGNAAISCRVPAGRTAGRVDIRVENLPSEGRIGQANSLPGGYEYLDDRVALSVLRVLPGSGPLEGGNLVAIEGTAFESGALVYFGGSPASEVQLLADNVLSARVPSGLAAGRVNVRVELRAADGPGESAILPLAYEYLENQVSDETLLVLGAYPNSGPLEGGNLVTVEGQGFAPGATVFFEGRPALDVRVLGSTAITCKAPSGAVAGMADLRVELPSGDAHTLANGYEYIDTSVDDSLLVLSAIPSEGPLSGGQVVAISGQGFRPGAVVYFGGIPASQVTVLGSTAITCRSPRGADAGFSDIRVELPAEPGGTPDAHTLIRGYEYFDDTVATDSLLVLGVIPSSGPLSGGNSVTIAGQGFAPGAVVYFGGQAASQIQVLGSNAITARPPAGVTPGFVDVRVQVAGGAAHSLPNAYQYLDDRAPPVELLVLGAIPNTGPKSGGNIVTISGQGFAPGASVFFGGNQATEVTVLGPTALTCKAPRGVAAGVTGIRVELSNGQAHSLANAYTYFDDSVAATPLVVFSTIPASGPQAGGNVVAIAGQGFAPGAVVYFGGTAATEVQVLGTSAITCKAPASASTGAVGVRVELPDSRVYTLPAGYSYVAAEGPRELKVTAVTPAQGSVAGGTIVAISGDGFVAGAVVYIGGIAASQVQVLGPTALTAKVPPGEVGLSDVRVQLPAGGVATLENGFEYYDDTEPPAPLLVLSAIPSRGPVDGGQIVTLAGSGFEPNAIVYFDGVAATDVQVLASTAITCRTPAGLEAGYVDITVENADGAQRSLYNGYEYLEEGDFREDLVVFKALPDYGPLSGGNVVAISGRGFAPGMKVYFGGAPATDVEVFGSTAVVCKAPRGTLPAGSVDLRVELPTIGGIAGDAYVLEDAYDYFDDTVQPDDLMVLATIPVSGPLSGGNVVTIAGQGFVSGARVYFGGVAATQVNVLAAEALTCVAPRGVAIGEVDIRVELPGEAGDADTLYNGYTYIDDSEPEEPFLVLKTIPNAGPVTGGNVVAIEGSGFVDGAKVYFGGSPATAVEVLGSKAITCRAPSSSAAGAVTIRVELPSVGGQAGAAYNLDNGYTYTAVDASTLRLATVYPIAGKVTGNELVLLTGTGFSPAMQVRFGTTASPLVQVLSANSATALTPPNTAGLVDVTLVNPDMATASLPQGFSYLSDAVVDPNLGPRLGGLLPSRGPAAGGTLVRVAGDNFGSGMKVKIGDTLATQVTVLSPTLATARIPAGVAGIVPVEIQNTNGLKDQLASGWTYTAAPANAPTIASVWPSQGPSTGGTWVVLEGTHFVDQSVVWFGMRPSVNTWFVSATRLIAEAPPGTVGSVDLSVVRPDGATVSRAAGFAYYSAQNLPAQPPVVGDVFPQVGSIDGGTEISVIGSNFAPDARVYFGRYEATVIRAIDGSIRVVSTPSHPPGSTSITVVNPSGLTHSKTAAFVFYAPPPLIRQVTPNRGTTLGGTVVSISGKNFRPDTTVRFGSMTISSFLLSTPIELRFFAPPSTAGKIDIRVDNPDGQHDHAPLAFEYVDESQLGSPVLTSIEPNRGPSVGGYIALIRGQNFAPGANVMFGLNDALEVEWLDATVLKVKVPAGQVNTTVAVTVENTPSLTTTKSNFFTYESQILEPLSIRKVSPGLGPTTGGTVITIEGAGFSADSVVTIGTTATDRVTFISSSTLTAISPPGLPGLVNVTVTRPDLSQAVAANAFAYQRPETLGRGPRVTSIRPVIGPMTGNALVVIEGSQFTGPAQVYFGANKAPVTTVLDGGRITVRTPATTQSGPVAVAVINADGLVGVAPGAYSYYDAAGVELPEVFLAQPNQGTSFGGQSVRILGDLLQGGAEAFLCEKPALVESLSGDDTLNIVTPPNEPGSCRITVVNPDGLTADRNNGFTYVAPAPIVTSITPSAGPVQGGIDVVIQGDNFVSGAAVKFGNATSPQVIVVDARTLAARLPANLPGTVSVSVINPGAQQATGTKENAFTYLEQVLGTSPTITTVSPSKGPLTGGTPVRVLGTNFANGALVILNGQSVTGVTVSSATEIRFSTPPAANPGKVSLTILNPDGLGATLAEGFEYQPPATPAPEITTIVPGSGPEAGNTTVTITGRNFSAAGTWSLGGKPLPSVATIGPTLVTAKTPASLPGKADLVYVGPDGQVAIKVAAFDYVAAPRLASVTPNLGGVSGNTEVTLIGDNFSPGMRVFFGSTQGEVLFVSSVSTAVARTPPSLTRGFVDVKVRNSDGQEGALLAGFEYLDPVDATGIWPPQGPNVGGTLVQISGTGMHPGSRVFFGPNEATQVYFDNYNRILAFSPMPTVANTVSVRILNPDGREDALANAFTYKATADLGPVPSISGFFPPSGPTTGGTRVAIDGVNLHTLGQAVFLPRPAESKSVRVDRAIVEAPPHALGSAPLYWVNPDGRTVQASSDFVYLDPANVGPTPAIRELTPLRGPTAGNTQVALLGVNFQPGARVRFGMNDAVTVNIAGTSAQVRTPSAPKGSVEVWLVNPDGSQALSSTTYLYLPPPDITAINPRQGPANGGTSVTIEGLDFRADPDGLLPQVLFCTSYDATTGVGTECTEAAAADLVAPLHGRQLQLKTPPHAPALVDVVVVAPDGQRDVALDAFTYTAVPVVADIDPDAGPTGGNQLVTITGSSFQVGANVLFDGKPATEVTVQSAGQLTCRTPANASGPADVTISNLDGGVTVARDFYLYLPPPIIDKLIPNAGPEEGGTVSTIQGTNFVGSIGVKPRVFFGTTEVAAELVTWLSSTAIRVTVPAGRGTVDVKVRNPDGQEGLGIDGFTYVPPLAAPTITYILPNNGTTLGGDTLRVYGSDFLSGAQVFLGKPNRDGDGTSDEVGEDWFEAPGPAGSNTPCDLRNNGTLLVCKTPAQGAGLVDIRVVNSDGQEDRLENVFTYIPPPEDQPISVINIQPNRSTVGGGKYMTIGGTGFKEGVTVRFFKDVAGVATAPFAEATEVQRIGPTLIRVKIPESPVLVDGVPAPSKIVVRVRNPGLAGTFVDAVGKFEYVSGPVFIRHPGDRLPNEGTGERGAMIFDANNDGLQDVLVYRDQDDRLLINGYEGRVGYYYEVDFPRYDGFYTDQAEAVDVDRDGDLDIVRMQAGNSRMQQCINQGGGSFATCYDLWYPSCNSVEFAVGDVSCDGIPDIVLPFNSRSCRPHVMLGNGSGGYYIYASMLPSFMEPTRGIAIGDIDNDGDNDLFLGNDESVQNRLYLNNCADLKLSGQCVTPIPNFTNKVFATGVNATQKNYAISDYATDWTSARNMCKFWGYDLAVFETMEEADFVRRDATLPRHTLWLGYYDPTADGTETNTSVTGVSGNPLFDRCGSTPYSTSYNCWLYNSDGGNSYANSCIHDYPCGNGYHFACEAPTGTPSCSGSWTFVDAQYGIGKTFPVSGGNTYDAMLVDIDEDNDLDAIAVQYNQPVNVYINTGGKFAVDDGLRWQQVGAPIERMTAADIDNDGDMDMMARLSGNEVRVYKNDRYTTGEPDGGGIFSNVTTTVWPGGNGKDPRTDVTGFAIGDINDDDLPDMYIVGRDRGDRIVLNDGYREGDPWRDDRQGENGPYLYRVGIGKFAFNTSRALPERYDNILAAALGDFDRDGDIDIAQCGYYQKMLMFYNDGAGKWTDVTSSTIPNEPWRCRRGSLESVDIDDDGDLDIIMEASSDGHSCPSSDCVGRAMLINDGFGHFSDVSAVQVPYDQWWGAEDILPLDLDNDNDLDWVVAYDYSSTVNRVYINGNDPFAVGGSFAFYRTDQWMTGIAGDTRYYLRDLDFIDLNGDPYPDIYVGRSGQNRVWMNDAGRKFLDVTAAWSPAISDDTHKVLVEDFDNDGDEDVYVINWGQNRFHYRETSKFADITGSALPIVSDQSIGGAAADFDLDGLLDVYIANSWQPNRMYLNLGGTEFQDLTANLPWDVHESQEVYPYDFDGDCDLDLYVVNYQEQDRIYINTLDPDPTECPDASVP